MSCFCSAVNATRDTREVPFGEFGAHVLHYKWHLGDLILHILHRLLDLLQKWDWIFKAKKQHKEGDQ